MKKDVIRVSTVGMTDAEWQEARMHSIGGSDAASVIGLNPYKSPYTLWAEKTGKVVPPDISKKESVRLGHFLEEYVARRFCEETGKRVRRETAILKNAKYPFAHANVDRLLAGEKAGLECKTTSELNLKKFKGGEYPAVYYAQCVHYLMVTGLERWYLAVLIGNREFRWFTIERDEDEIAALAKAEEAFWKCVTEGSPPGVIGLKDEIETMQEITPVTDGNVDLFGLDTIVASYISIGDRIRDLKKEQDSCKSTICKAMNGFTKGVSGDHIVRWTPYERATVDMDRLISEHPEINIDKYKKVSISRRFTVE